MNTDEVVVRLSKAQALVLFEWLARSDDAKLLPTDFPAEQKVLWDVEGQLEKQVNAFASNYKLMLDAAREEIDASR